MILSIFFNFIFILLIFVSITISSLALIIIFIYIRPSITNVSLLLTCNSYLTIILFCLTLFDIGGHTIYGYINPSIVFSRQWCKIRSYLAHVCFCAFYYSFVLQAIFRLFRIVFYKRKILQTFGIFLIAIFLQWFFSFIFILPHLIFNDFQYQDFNYNCWISFKNLRGMFFAILSIYGGPLTITFIIYVCILRFIRQTTNLQQKRQKSNKRDVVILRRIIILLLFLIMFGIPTLSVLVIYIITDYLTPLNYDIQSLNISIGLVITPITLVFVTPTIRHIFRRKKRKQKKISTNSSPSRQIVDNGTDV